MEDLLDLLEYPVRQKLHYFDPSIFILRGLWKCQYILQLTPEESIFNLNYVIAQTVGQGCCYFDTDEPNIDEGFIGLDTQKTIFENRALRIAVLDAIYSSLNGSPNDTYYIKGSNVKKAHKRANIVCDQAINLLRTRSPKHGDKMSVLNVGVVGSFLSILTNRSDLDVKACDLYPGVIGKTIHGVTIEGGTKTGSSNVGDRTLELVAESDLAIVTGMTLFNYTLAEILSTALNHKTALVLFAETGANFASEYCKMGIDVVISEPFPFYLTSSGTTKISVYRK